MNNSNISSCLLSTITSLTEGPKVTNKRNKGFEYSHFLNWPFALEVKTKLNKQKPKWALC